MLSASAVPHGATAPRTDAPIPQTIGRERSRKGRPGNGYKGSDDAQIERIAAAHAKRLRKMARNLSQKAANV